ncbi:pyridoxamine 5'-phosphate oxidase-related FMN- binding [Catenulispora acidiphila DSM 44928]|uniref:Pyridoxamine 5'-phosphate oxidase-related FMN-binding n=1 Tax=Catenulispora acidiphila (strain DSM 44928 / JCM 14897 / NBRC 102108 / NRRL B-24433 / ID139908) TaxID=479433 RepID=C7Q4Z1_CATAD|nr:pyridoxamine 5'-phosphate oxidase family protein [Catenulispora acidiphila]ACU73939.1 pyridoxamine 5'-phosphate oxidase-related FMN- binding [Catenulispora acidiphila DSM 44928]
MPEIEPIGELDARFSERSAKARPWAEVAEVLAAREMFWLSSVRGDGRPHVVPLPAVWLDGALYFCSGSDEQKTKNLLFDPRCVLSAGANALHFGLDVVVEGSAARVTDQDLLQRLVALWKSKLDWDFQAAEDGFRDPHAPNSSVFVFGVKPVKVLAFDKGPYGQTRYSFPA